MILTVNGKCWRINNYNRQQATGLAHSLGVFETTAGLLWNRGITTPTAAKLFLRPKLTDLYPPLLMQDMAQAVARVKCAIAHQEKILIYGDYDVDGTTATVILKKALEWVGAAVHYYIPQRLVDGYGMRETAIDKAHAEGYQLIISVDCGIRAHAVVAYAQQLGVDVIITDHHLPEGHLPAAIAVLNPKREDCSYPDKNLAGCGVAFKLAQALLAEYGRSEKIDSLLRIAAIGTIADVVPLIGENRIIAKCGLAGLSKPDNIGLRALLDVSGVSRRNVTYQDVGYRIAPRINAVGRMGRAGAAVELFSSSDPTTAMELARQMDQQNIARQKTEADIIQEIMLTIEQQEIRENSVIVLAAERWHRGVIGIAASKLVERTNCSAVVIAIEAGLGYGSGRAAGDFPLLTALDSCQDLFEHYGGHMHAAGLTLRAENVAELRRRLNEFATSWAAPITVTTPELQIDARLTFAEVNADLMREIALLEPFGTANPLPIFLAEDVQIVEKPLILRERHLRLRLAQYGQVFDAVWWGAAALQSQLLTKYQGKPVQVAFSLTTTTRIDTSQIQIVVKDISL
jgi:single-stranded-DNA-specific exonuclease